MSTSVFMKRRTGSPIAVDHYMDGTALLIGPAGATRMRVELEGRVLAEGPAENGVTIMPVGVRNLDDGKGSPVTVEGGEGRRAN